MSSSYSPKTPLKLLCIGVIALDSVLLVLAFFTKSAQYYPLAFGIGTTFGLVLALIFFFQIIHRH